MEQARSQYEHVAAKNKVVYARHCLTASPPQRGASQALTERLAALEQTHATHNAALRETQQLRSTCEELRTQLNASHKEARELRQLLHTSEQALQEATLKGLQVRSTAGYCQAWLERLSVHVS